MASSIPASSPPATATTPPALPTFPDYYYFGRFETRNPNLVSFAGIPCESNATDYCWIEPSAVNNLCKGLPHCRGFVCYDPPGTINACFIFLDGMEFVTSVDLQQGAFLQNGLGFSQTGTSGTPVLPISSSTSSFTPTSRASSSLTSPQSTTTQTTSPSLPEAALTASTPTSTTIAIIVTCIVLVLLLILGLALYILRFRRRRLTEKSIFDPRPTAFRHAQPPTTLPPVVVHGTASEAYHNNAQPRNAALADGSIGTEAWDVPPEPAALEREVKELREQLGQMRSLVVAATGSSSSVGASSGSVSAGDGMDVTVVKGSGLFDPRVAVAAAREEGEVDEDGNSSPPRYSDHASGGSEAGVPGAGYKISIKEKKI
ncbi:hypothetical protein HK101_001490 [Irineochytrium annulatum]|nr:hypothetical protein HK101_001490 [Irineochytrium annulatum]